MIAATGLELRAGARLLLDDATFRIGPGDKVGLVGRNGAGKTTLTRVLAGEALPAAGTVRAHRLQSATCRRTRGPATWTSWPATGSCPARGLDAVLRGLRAAEQQMASDDPAPAGPGDAPLRPARGRARRCWAATPPRPRPPRIAAASACRDRVLGQPLRTLSGGQRRRVELARILFSGAQTLLLDEPTNHLDADSIGWLREFLRAHRAASW